MKARACLCLALMGAACAAVAVEDYRVTVGDPVEVRARERVDVAFRARAAKGACLEGCPDFRNAMTLVACSPHWMPAGSRFASVALKFFGADGKAIAQSWVTQGAVLVWSRAWRAYRHSAYAPDGATRAQLCVIRREKGNEVEIDGLTFARADPFQAPVRSLNPQLDYGPFNTSGYSFMGSARWRTTPEGKNWLDLLQGSCYPDPFPVKGGERLAIRFHGESPAWLHCFVCFYESYGEAGSLTKNRNSFVLDVHNERHRPERVERVVVPPDATWARVYFQPQGKIEDFRVVADEEAER